MYFILFFNKREKMQTYPATHKKGQLLSNDGEGYLNKNKEQKTFTLANKAHNKK